MTNKSNSDTCFMISVINKQTKKITKIKSSLTWSGRSGDNTVHNTV